jgi:hypothetical protein
MIPGILMPAIVYGGVKLIERAVEAIAGGETGGEATAPAGAMPTEAPTDPEAASLWDQMQRTAVVMIDSAGKGLEAALMPPHQAILSSGDIQGERLLHRSDLSGAISQARNLTHTNSWDASFQQVLSVLQKEQTQRLLSSKERIMIRDYFVNQGSDFFEAHKKGFQLIGELIDLWNAKYGSEKPITVADLTKMLEELEVSEK